MIAFTSDQWVIVEKSRSARRRTGTTQSCGKTATPSGTCSGASR